MSRCANASQYSERLVEAFASYMDELTFRSASGCSRALAMAQKMDKLGAWSLV